MEMFAFVSAVCGYHVYQDVFTPSIGEKLVAKREFNNTMDKQERNGLVYKPHPRFLAQNFSKKVRLIHESLR